VILLDTHVLLWWQADGERLSDPARRSLEVAETILVSPVSFWEIGLLVEKGRIRLDRDPFVWSQDLLAQDRIDVAPLTPVAALSAGRLTASGFQGDPADALIYATAQDLGVPLVSKDERIRTYAAEHRDFRAIW
jgi:PIN domain nuclease of toxin-antitoxin system